MGRWQMSNADWWAKQMGVQPAAQQPRPANVPVPPSQTPMTRAPMPQQQAPRVNAQSANQTESCPNCGGNNYMSPMPNIAKRCMDCGHPIEQSGSRFGALTGAKVEGQTKAARGNDPTNNYNPQQIIGRIDG